MPAIWNITGSNIVSDKKLSSKLTFNVGEKFTGKVIKKDGSKEVTIKLSDGWQFKAEIDEEIDLSEKTVFKFIVEDLKDGKLKLKIVKENNESIEERYKNKNNILSKFIKSEGLSKLDLPLLKEMIKREIPLTRENINKFKEIINFNTEIKENPKEIENFINKFLASKEIDKSSELGIKIESLLKDFMKAFKTLSKEDTMFFLENNIELNKENIESFNKLFNKPEGVNELIKNLKEAIGENNSIELLKDSKSECTNSILDKTIINKKDIIEDETLNNKSIIENLDSEKSQNNVLSKNVPLGNAYGSNEMKGSMLQFLKTIIGEEKDSLENIVKNIVSNKIEKEEFKNIELKLDKIINEDLKKEYTDNKIIKKDNENFINREEVVSKTSIEKNLSKIIGGDIKLTVKEYETILKGIIKEVDSEPEKNIDEKININEKIFEESNLKGKEVEKEIKFKLNNIKEMISLVKNEDSTSKLNEKIIQFVKGNSSDFKIFNSISNEYYYLDIPVKVNEKDYPCKLIIKDNRKDDKKIDKNNFKVVVSIKTSTLGVIDSYIHLNNKTLNVLLKCDDDRIIKIEREIERLKQSLSTMGLDIKISVDKKNEEVTMSNCREFFSIKENSFLDRKV